MCRTGCVKVRKFFVKKAKRALSTKPKLFILSHYVTLYLRAEMKYYLAQARLEGKEKHCLIHASNGRWQIRQP